MEIIMKSKFGFFERVKIINTIARKKQNLIGKKAVIFGKSQDDLGKWYYRIKIENQENAEYVQENELESLGIFAKREDYYSGESIRVGVNKKGEGYIIEDDK